MRVDLPTLLATTLIGVLASGIGVAVRVAFQRLRESEARQAAILARLVTVEGRSEGVDDAQLRALAAEMRECMAERYVRRDDYVTHTAGVASRLDALSLVLAEQRAMLARVEERIGGMMGGAS